ncbi:hypothetical protein A8139_14860 [Marinomonas primoryensis]|uniref:DUF1788 domain-containing protein n=1 Tax=Marinomonas primoryensis TaxID=178399 RepID=A0A2Z4PUA9_9GAMM|nr:DUF1788 domain-containing protein [Marinomonas primoryensis]AWY01113.1 hypothetical protein A8139_14860 [Marinomonas primoryensis]
MVSSLNCINKKNLQQAYEKLIAIVSDDGFLTNQGLNNEVPFHICPYDPSTQVDINQMVRQLKNDLQEKSVSVLEVNLYDLVVETLKQEGDWEWLLENEASMSRDELREELQGMVDVENGLIPAIVSKMDAAKFQVLFLTGAGEVFPYMRMHNVLNNLQKRAKDKPTLMFFPGLYQHSLEKGASLELFGKLKEDGYYRAFNILDRAI